MRQRRSAARIVRPLRGGQITIPAEFRRRLGIDEGTLLQLTLDDGELRLRPLRAGETAAGSAWFAELYDLFAPVREEAAGQTEQEIDEAIQRAVAASRRKNA